MMNPILMIQDGMSDMQTSVDTMAAAGTAETARISLWDMALNGGWIMLVLLVMLALAIYIAVERYLALRQAVNEFELGKDTFGRQIIDETLHQFVHIGGSFLKSEGVLLMDILLDGFNQPVGYVACLKFVNLVHHDTLGSGIAFKRLLVGVEIRDSSY